MTKLLIIIVETIYNFWEICWSMIDGKERIFKMLKVCPLVKRMEYKNQTTVTGLNVIKELKKSSETSC